MSYYTDMQGRWVIDRNIFNLGIRIGSVVRFTPQPYWPRGKIADTNCTGRPQNRFHFEMFILLSWLQRILRYSCLFFSSNHSAQCSKMVKQRDHRKFCVQCLNTKINPCKEGPLLLVLLLLLLLLLTTIELYRQKNKNKYT